ncbi:MAG: glycosyltransferase family 9 protein [Anaerovibrio sp.]|uniref:glycosyltransferase family 9 protein n=1 Tax=Anaerovibrio sp. TaxID=1872532 RepID=UPI001B0BB186|nr:glycosyltransferase family 9 protein [Anaerovibrio sp.]MBO6245601.1 glycosyltransferase family 9 protein [Anaerovibrio sp.]
MEIWYGKYEKMVARKLLSGVIPSIRKVIAIGLGAGGENRKYPVKKYAEACNILSKNYEVYFVIVGGRSEQHDAAYLQSVLVKGTSCNFTGKTSILETAAVLSLSNLYVGNDTGVMHIAAAVGIPVVMVSREKYDYDESLAGIMSENIRFAPWDTNT